MTTLTIGIITCSRPKALMKCVDSLRNNVDIPFKILIVDSTPISKRIIKNEYRIIYKHMKAQELNFKVIEFDAPISPAKARKIISDNLDTEYLLYLDDDIVVRKSTVKSMIDKMESFKEIDIISGIWKEYGIYREVGQFFNYGYTYEGQTIVWKSFLYKENLDKNLSTVKVDAAQATLLLRKSVFNKISFDENINFFYELFDFFMQAKKENLKVYVDLDAEFEHYPLMYKTKTKRNEEVKKDKMYFENKWGLKVVGSLGFDKLSFIQKLKRKFYIYKSSFQ